MSKHTRNAVHPNHLKTARQGCSVIFQARSGAWVECLGDHDVDRAGKRVALIGDGRREHIAECRHQRREAGPAWASLALGRCGHGEFGLNLADKPHAIIAGQPGTGKTVALRFLMAEALRKGFKVVHISAEAGAYVLGRRLDAALNAAHASALPVLVAIDDLRPFIPRREASQIQAEIDRFVKAASGTGMHLVVTREDGNTFLPESLVSQAAEIELVETGLDAHGGRVRWIDEDHLRFAPDGTVELAEALAAA